MSDAESKKHKKKKRASVTFNEIVEEEHLPPNSPENERECPFDDLYYDAEEDKPITYETAATSRSEQSSKKSRESDVQESTRMWLVRKPKSVPIDVLRDYVSKAPKKRHFETLIDEESGEIELDARPADFETLHVSLANGDKSAAIPADVRLIGTWNVRVWAKFKDESEQNASFVSFKRDLAVDPDKKRGKVVVIGRQDSIPLTDTLTEHEQRCIRRGAKRKARKSLAAGSGVAANGDQTASPRSKRLKIET